MDNINNAMSLIEEHNEDLKGVLPKSYNKMNDVLLADLLTFNSISILQQIILEDL